MGIFGKKDNKEEVQDRSIEVTGEGVVPTAPGPDSVPQPSQSVNNETGKPGTGVADQSDQASLSEKNAVKMLVTWYPDTGQLAVENIQNLSRGNAEFIAYRILKNYDSDAVAFKTTDVLINTISKIQKNKTGLWVPGEKR